MSESPLMEHGESVPSVAHGRLELPLTEHGESVPSVAHARSESLLTEHEELVGNLLPSVANLRLETTVL